MEHSAIRLTNLGLIITFTDIKPFPYLLLHTDRLPFILYTIGAMACHHHHPTFDIFEKVWAPEFSRPLKPAEGFYVEQVRRQFHNISGRSSDANSLDIFFEGDDLPLTEIEIIKQFSRDISIKDLDIDGSRKAAWLDERTISGITPTTKRGHIEARNRQHPNELTAAELLHRLREVVRNP
jgi:hypothetical protein